MQRVFFTISFFILIASCTKDKRSITYDVLASDSQFPLTGKITVSETKKDKELSVTISLSGIDFYEGIALNTHIHTGSYPVAVGRVDYDFMRQTVTDGKVNASLVLPLNWQQFMDYDAVFVIHKSNRVDYLGTAEMGKL